MKPRLKFGIVGTGFIADVVADAIKQTETSLVAVASRRHENARAFADKHGGMQVFESWGDLVACDGLDAVYVATPTSVREEICIVAAQNKKHVLAEKPFASEIEIFEDQRCRKWPIESKRGDVGSLGHA